MTSDEMLGVLTHMFTVELTPADLAEARLTEAGIDPGAVTHVVNSHLHFDHCGHNGPFAEAVTLVQPRNGRRAVAPDTAYSYVGLPLEEIGAGDLRRIDGEVNLSLATARLCSSRRRDTRLAINRSSCAPGASPAPMPPGLSATRATCATCWRLASHQSTRLTHKGNSSRTASSTPTRRRACG